MVPALPQPCQALSSLVFLDIYLFELSRPRSGAAAGRSYPMPPCPHARGQGRGLEELPGAVAARAHEGLEELSDIEGQEGWR